MIASLLIGLLSALVSLLILCLYGSLRHPSDLPTERLVLILNDYTLFSAGVGCGVFLAQIF